MNSHQKDLYLNLMCRIMDMSNVVENKKAFPLRGRCQRKLTDEVEMNNDCFRNLHLTTAYGGASPQGEAFERLHLNLMHRNLDVE